MAAAPICRSSRSRRRTKGARDEIQHVTLLASSPRPVRAAAAGGQPREKEAAVLIQKVFLGYLARKALWALRSLVKLQALVRGYLVRKQTARTLHRLQALMRLQASSHALKNLSSRRSSSKSGRCRRRWRTVEGCRRNFV